MPSLLNYLEKQANPAILAGLRMAGRGLPGLFRGVSRSLRPAGIAKSTMGWTGRAINKGLGGIGGGIAGLGQRMYNSGSAPTLGKALYRGGRTFRNTAAPLTGHLANYVAKTVPGAVVYSQIDGRFGPPRYDPRLTDGHLNLLNDTVNEVDYNNLQEIVRSNLPSNLPTQVPQVNTPASRPSGVFDENGISNLNVSQGLRGLYGN